MNLSFPKLGQSLLILFLTFICQFSLGVIIVLLCSIAQIPLNTIALAGFVNLITIGSVIVYSLKYRGEDFIKAYSISRFPIYHIIPIFICVIGLSFLVNELSNAINSLFIVPDLLSNMFPSPSSPINDTLILVITLSIIAPITEEFLFRALFLKSFLTQYKPLFSVIISSLLFSFFHLNPAQFLSTFILGIIFALWFIRYNSILPCIIGHAFYNFIPVLTIYIFKISTPDYSSNKTMNVFQPLWIDLLSIAAVVVTLIFIFKNNKLKPAKELM